MKVNRFLPLVIPVLIFLLQQLYFFSPKFIYLVLVLINILLFFALWQFSQASQVDKKWWNFLIQPSLLTTAVVVYCLFLSQKIIIELLFLANLVLLYFYLRQVYYYLIKPTSYQVFSLENLSVYGNFLTFFLLAASVYGLQSYLGLAIWPLELVFLMLVALIIYQVIWANKIEIKRALSYLLLVCLVLVELSWALSFLPFNHHVLALLLAICYYLIIGLTRCYLLNKLDKKIVRVYLTLGLAGIIILLMTARWL